MTSGAFDEDGIEQARALLADIERNLPRTAAASGTIVGDQTKAMIRVLRILTDQVESLRDRLDGN